jgi:uncharacterized membrane protein (DUF2068 family)
VGQVPAFHPLHLTLEVRVPGKRPIGVTLIVILKILDGLWGLASGCALLAGGGALAAVILRFVRDAPPWVGEILGGALAVVGLILIFFSLLDFVLAWGVWTLRRWAWWLTMIEAVLSILGSVSTLAGGNLTSIPSVVLNGVIIVLLLTSSVRRALG